MKLFIFGSTGDLVRRKVMPALIDLNLKTLRIFALGRRELNSLSYEKLITGGGYFKILKNKPRYLRIDLNKKVILKEASKLLDKKRVNFFYIAMPPKELRKICLYLGSLKKEGFKLKILIEKPFGENLKDAKSLLKIILKEKLNEEIFIADHYLFKEEIKGLHISKFNQFKIVSLENIGLENRWTYYEGIGAMSDMIQSHFFNIIFKYLDNPLKELKDIKIMSYIRGQYENYSSELGKKSHTETFIKLKIKTKNHIFTFITGKKFNKKLAFIEVDNKKIPLHNSKNPYNSLFLNFFNQNRKNFPTIEDAILAWKIISRIENKNPKLWHYPDNYPVLEIIKDH